MTQNGKIQPDQSFEVDVDDFETTEEFLKAVGSLFPAQFRANAVFEIAFEDGCFMRALRA